MFEALLTKFSVVAVLTATGAPLDLMQQPLQTVSVAESASPDQILEAFTNMSTTPPSSEASATALLVHLRNESEADHLLLEAGPQLRGSVELWRLDPTGPTRLGILHSSQNPELRVVHSRLPNLGFELPKGHETILLAKLQGTQRAHLRLHAQEEFVSLENRSVIYYCFLLGSLLVLGAYHTLIWFSVRESIYLLYALLCTTAFLATAGQSGYLTLYGAQLANSLAFPLTQLRPWSLLVLTFYLTSFLSLQNVKGWVSRAVAPTQLLCVGLGLGGLLAPGLSPWVALGCLLVLSVLTAITYQSHRSGSRVAGLVVPGIFFAALTQAIFILQDLQVFPSLWAHVSLAPLGSTVMIAFLAFGLGARLRYLEEQQKEAEAHRQREEEEHKAEVLELNRQLEARVEEQTRDIRSMLENTKIGILSVVDDLSVHKDYARYLETILEEQEIAGRSFFDIMLEKAKLGADEKDRIATAMEYSIGEDQIFFEANASCLPPSLVVGMKDGHKHLDLDWSPIPDRDGSVEKILVSVRDMTEVLELKAQADAGKRMLNLISELIDLGPRRFQKFEKACDEACHKIAPYVHKGLTEQTLLGDDIRQIYVVLHTIKGISRMYKLSELTNAIHLAEDIVDKRPTLTPEEIHALDAALQLIQERRKEYQLAMQPLLKLQSELKEASQTSLSNLHVVLQDLGQTADILARELGKQGCRFSIDIREGLELSPDFIQALQKSLVHIIRNAIDHGLESPEVRKQKGKDPIGSLRVFQDSEGRLCFEDDGQGLRLDLIRNKSKELLGREPAHASEAAEVIFLPGFSTKATADEISGRGVGMDAIREFMRAVGSDVNLVPKQTDEHFMQFYLAIELPLASHDSSLRKAS